MINLPRKHALLTRLFVPSVASAAIHLALLALVLAATVTISARSPERRPLTDIAIAPAESAQQTPTATQPPPAVPTGNSAPGAVAPGPTPSLIAPGIEAVRAPAPTLAQPTSAAASVAIEPAPQARSVSFAGVSAQAAERIVYVVDAPGSSAGTYAFVRARLAQSISHLSPTQRFQVILVRGAPDGSPDVQMLPSEPGSNDPLVRALPSVRESAIAWLRSVVVAGHSDPIAGLQEALELHPRPDVVFFLARGYKRSGPNSEWGEGVDKILASLDRLNPRARRTGLRPVVIKTIQFLEDDPTGLMRAIAEAHGDGPGSFRVLTDDDLADEGVDEAPIARQRASDVAVRRAREALSAAAPAELHLLYGISTPEQHRTASAAVELALKELPPPAADDPGAGVRAHALLLQSALASDVLAAAEAAAILEQTFVIDADADAARRLLFANALARAGRLDQARSIADGLSSDIAVLALPDAFASELGALRARFGLGVPLLPDGDWAQITAEAQSRHLLDDPATRSQAFTPLLTWAGDDPARSAIAWRLVAAATTTEDVSLLPPEARFARAMGLATAEPATALSELVALVASESDGPVSRQALWEAGVLAADQADPRTPALLEQFATRYPDDDRSIDALIVALDRTPTHLEHRGALLRHLLDVAPRHASAASWRLELAELLPPREAIKVLADIDAGSPAAAIGADRVCALTQGSSDPALLAPATHLLERGSDPRAAALRTRLSESLLERDPQAALDAARPLDGDRPAVALLRAQALLGLNRKSDAQAQLEPLTRQLGPESPDYWHVWTLLLESLAGEPDQADTIRAHLFRLRLAAPDLGGSPWRDRLEAIESMLTGP